MSQIESSSDLGQRFNGGDVEVINREVVYQGFFQMEKLTLRHRLFGGGWSKSISREVFMRGQAVAAILYDPKHQLIGLVEQFRVGVLADTLVDTDAGAKAAATEVSGIKGSPWCYEVVAGMAEVGETHEQVILRELEEESGVQPYQLDKICHYYSSPGGTNERLTLYCALADLSEAGGLFGLEEESEDIRMLALPEERIFNSLYSGQYGNAATLLCLQWLQLHKHTFSPDDKVNSPNSNGVASL